MYKKDMLKEYIKNSELRIFCESIKVRLSKELAFKYDNGCYDNYLKHIENYFNMIKDLNITYPGGANPVLYIYLVPDEDYAELLKIPSAFNKGKGGGKPVICYDLDGFNSAYGVSQNLCENKQENITDIAKIVNQIHELSHIIHSQFFSKNNIISEGFAEALPLYILDLEQIFDEHKNTIIKLNENQLLSAQEILNSEKDNTFGIQEILPNKSCSFRLSYISSYLFVRGCMEKIKIKFNLNKAQTVQYFLEIIKQSNCINEWLIYDLAEAIDIPKDILLNGKQIQMKVLDSLHNSSINDNLKTK